MIKKIAIFTSLSFNLFSMDSVLPVQDEPVITPLWIEDCFLTWLSRDVEALANIDTLSPFLKTHLMKPHNREALLHFGPHLLKLGECENMLTWAIECGYKRLARFIVVNNDQFDGNPRFALDKGDYQGHFPIDATLESSEVELLRLLITHGSNPVAAFQRALSSDNFYVIRLLINETSMRRLGGFWEKEEDMLFNIHCFAYDCKNDLLKRLLKKYHQTLSGQKDITPAVKAAIFHLAVFLEGIEVVQKIFDSGFELDRTDRSIVHATEKGNLELVMLLILHRADPALRSKNGTNLLFKAVQMSRYESESTNYVGVIKALLEGGVSPKEQAWHSLTPLHFADNFEIASLLVAYNADVNALDDRGMSPLHAIVSPHVDVEVVKFLLNNSADPMLRDQSGNCALHACSTPSLLRLLLTWPNVMVNAINQSKQTALHAAVTRADARCSSMLLAHDVSISAKDEKGDTALHRALILGNAEVIRALFQGIICNEFFRRLPESRERVINLLCVFKHLALAQGCVDLIFSKLDECSVVWDYHISSVSLTDEQRFSEDLWRHLICALQKRIDVRLIARILAHISYRAVKEFNLIKNNEQKTASEYYTSSPGADESLVLILNVQDEVGLMKALVPWLGGAMSKEKNDS